MDLVLFAWDYDQMTVEWGSYRPYAPPVYGPPHEMSRRDARACFDDIMASRDERETELRELLRINGIELSHDDDGIGRVDDWWCENVERSQDNAERLRNLWYAVAHDLALFLGEILVEHHPGLRWEMFIRGKRDAAFQRHVIVGFARVPNTKYNLDMGWMVMLYGIRASGGADFERGYFTRMLYQQGAYA